jgi:hypothetical protein
VAGGARQPGPFAQTCLVPVVSISPAGGSGALLRQCPSLVQLSTRRPELRWFDLLDQVRLLSRLGPPRKAGTLASRI